MSGNLTGMSAFGMMVIPSLAFKSAAYAATFLEVCVMVDDDCVDLVAVQFWHSTSSSGYRMSSMHRSALTLTFGGIRISGRTHFPDMAPATMNFLSKVSFFSHTQFGGTF